MFSIVDHAIRPEFPEYSEQKMIVAGIPDINLELPTAEGLPEGGPAVQIGDRDKGLPVQFRRCPPAEIIVHHRHFMAPPGKIHGRGPAQVTVASQDQDAHAGILVSVLTTARSSGNR